MTESCASGVYTGLETVHRGCINAAYSASTEVTHLAFTIMINMILSQRVIATCVPACRRNKLVSDLGNKRKQLQRAEAQPDPRDKRPELDAQLADIATQLYDTVPPSLHAFLSSTICLQ